MVDTNSDPNMVDFPIPANDDASNSISLIINAVAGAIMEGLNERKAEREKEGDNPEKEAKPDKAKARKGGDKRPRNIDALVQDEEEIAIPKVKFEKEKDAPRKVAKKVKKED
jgi:small subunit ribosomal protein S2